VKIDTAFHGSLTFQNKLNYNISRLLNGMNDLLYLEFVENKSKKI
jgi:hypothetical protein